MLPAEFEQLLGRQRRTYGDKVIREYEHRAEVGAEVILPCGKAAEIVARGPIFPVLMVLVARGKAAALHVDEPTCLAGRRDDEVETLQRTARYDAAPRFIDGDVSQPASAKECFERGLVMVVAVHVQKALGVSPQSLVKTLMTRDQH